MIRQKSNQLIEIPGCGTLAAACLPGGGGRRLQSLCRTKEPRWPHFPTVAAAISLPGVQKNPGHDD
jgi:hypothetical protein